MAYQVAIALAPELIECISEFIHRNSSEISSLEDRFSTSMYFSYNLSKIMNIIDKFSVQERYHFVKNVIANVPAKYGMSRYYTRAVSIIFVINRQ
jgi:hypothetical protein